MNNHESILKLIECHALLSFSLCFFFFQLDSHKRNSSLLIK